MHGSIGAGDSDEDGNVIPLLIEWERAALRELKETRAARQVSATIMYMYGGEAQETGNNVRQHLVRSV